MRIAVLANDEQWKEIDLDTTGIHRFQKENFQQDDPSFDAYIILEEIDSRHLQKIQKPILLNSVITTLKDLQAADNVVRINGWNSFLSRSTWEVSGSVNDELKQIFTALNKQYIKVEDEPGLVAARIISMIINEAYFALGENVSSKEEIDTAMKLGTHYPYGPFEWTTIIGASNVYDLLLLLSRHDKRYLPALLLQTEALV